MSGDAPALAGEPDRPRAPRWIFGITSIPFGVSGGFTVVLPFLLRRAGLSVESIGWYSSVSLIPSFAQFLYAPVIDLGPRRRTWLVVFAFLGALCLGTALSIPLPSGATPFMALTFVGQVLLGLIGSCNGGLLATTLANEERGRAAGWLNAGNLGGSALSAGAILLLVGHVPSVVMGATLVAMCVVPALAALTIPEPIRPHEAPRELFANMFSEVWRTARSRAGWTGILFCISPVGTAALLNEFAGVAVDYHAKPGMVAFVQGAVSGLVTAVGALVGGVLCDRFDRRMMYLLSGGLTAVVAATMILGGLNPTTYLVGVTAYLLVSGFCYSAFSAVVLEAIGKAGHSAAAQYTLFTAAGNLAITYVGFFDTRFHHHYGPRGLLGADALLNVVGIAFLLLMIALVTRTDARRARATA